MVGVLHRINRVIERLAVATAAPAVVRDANAAAGSVLQGQDGAGCVTDSLVVEDLQRHEPGPPLDAGQSNAVVAPRPDDACDVGAVAVQIRWIAVVVGEVPAVQVVDIAVAIIVQAVERLPGVLPHVALEVRVRAVDPGVQDCHAEILVAAEDGPGSGRLDPGHVPEAAVRRIVRCVAGAQSQIGLRILHLRVPAQQGECLGHRASGPQVEALEVRHEGKGDFTFRSRRGSCLTAHGFLGQWLEANEHAIMPLHSARGLRKDGFKRQAAGCDGTPDQCTEPGETLRVRRTGNGLHYCSARWRGEKSVGLSFVKV